MGLSQSVSTEIEIQASPDVVRAVFFDFNRCHEWSKWKIEHADSSKNPSEVKENDRLKLNLDGAAFSARVVENSAQCFAWYGSIWPLFTGRHQFYFSPSTKTPGGTTAVQAEDFWGLLVFLVAPGWSLRQQTLDNWNKFFADLKAEAE